MTDEATGQLLGRFVSAVQPVLPLVSVWAHGSLAGGDYQPGRSDLDLVAILGRPCTAAEEQQLAEMHESLGSNSALASKLHCSYCAAVELDDPARSHLTWAHEELMRRPVTPVTRRELHDFGLVLYGEEPAALLPAVTGEQLAEFVTLARQGQAWHRALTAAGVPAELVMVPGADHVFSSVPAQQRLRRAVTGWSERHR